MTLQTAVFEVPLFACVVLALRSLADVRPPGAEYWGGMLLSIGVASFLGFFRFALAASADSLLLQAHLLSVQVVVIVSITCVPITPLPRVTAALPQFFSTVGVWGFLLGSVSSLVRRASLPMNTTLLALAVSAHVFISGKNPLMIHVPVIAGTFLSAVVRHMSSPRVAWGERGWVEIG